MTTNISRFRGDAWHFLSNMPDQSVGTIITDPMYDTKVDMNELRRVCKGAIIMFSSPENEFFVPDERAYWVKTPSTKNFSKHLGRFVEHILIDRVPGQYYYPGLHWSNYIGVYSDVLLEKPKHPYQKPLSLIERLVLIYTPPGSVVLDPFMGSGVLLEACHKHGRSSIGYEIREDYFHLTDWVDKLTGIS